MAASKEQILEAISNMTIMDVVDLVKMMEDKFGVTAAVPVAIAAAAGGAAAAPAAEEQTEFTVTLKAYPADKKVGVINLMGRLFMDPLDDPFQQIEQLLKTGSGARGPGSGGQEHRFGEALLVIGDSPVSDRDQIGLLLDGFRQKHRNAVQVLFTAGERPGVHVGVTDDLVAKGVKAGDLVARIAAVSGGKGGGRPHFASGGLGDAGQLEATREKTPEIVRAALAGEG